VTNSISNVLVEVKEFVLALNAVQIDDEDYHLMVALVSRINDATSEVKDEKTMESMHRL
jgi:hypothetical protein